MSNLYIISLGGSLIIPKSQQQINTTYLSRFKQLLSTHIQTGDSFILITGGGYLARHYQEASTKITDLSAGDKDWLGIYATHLNAHLVRTIFQQWSYPEIIIHPDTEYPDIEKYPLAIAGGWHPGNSTDYVAVCLAERFQASFVINLSNIDYVYTDDPETNPNAQALDNISWVDFRDMVGNTWDPGASAPFDPIASKKAQELNLPVTILNGEDIDNLDNYLNGNPFRGTTIQ